MPIVAMKDMLQHAYGHCYAVGAFDVLNLDSLQGIITAAERCHSPVILNLTESHFDYFDFELLMPAVETAARRSAIPVAIHLHDGMNLASTVHAINSGCNSVMLSTYHDTFSDNIQHTREVVNMAHTCGIPVEGELGNVLDVDAIKYYVEQTNVDFLAINTNTLYGQSKTTPS